VELKCGGIPIELADHGRPPPVYSGPTPRRSLWVLRRHCFRHSRGKRNPAPQTRHSPLEFSLARPCENLCGGVAWCAGEVAASSCRGEVEGLDEALPPVFSLARFRLKARRPGISALALRRPRTRAWRAHQSISLCRRMLAARVAAHPAGLLRPAVHRLRGRPHEAAHDHPYRTCALTLPTAGSAVVQYFIFLLLCCETGGSEGFPPGRTLPVVARASYRKAIAAEVFLALGVDRLRPRHDRVIGRLATLPPARRSNSRIIHPTPQPRPPAPSGQARPMDELAHVVALVGRSKAAIRPCLASDLVWAL